MNKHTQIILRVSEIEKQTWKDFAATRGQSLSEFIRFVVNMKIETVSEQSMAHRDDQK